MPLYPVTTVPLGGMRTSKYPAVENSVLVPAFMQIMRALQEKAAPAEAAEGSAALAKVQSNSFALIISDWHMEPMDGMTFLKEVRRTSRPGANRFIFMTTERTWGAKTSAKIEGAEAFLPKPFDQKTLRATIEKVLS